MNLYFTSEIYTNGHSFLNSIVQYHDEVNLSTVHKATGLTAPETTLLKYFAHIKKLFVLSLLQVIIKSQFTMLEKIC